ncbi:Aquaporin NIP6-1 [Linum perenne]
MHPSSAMDNNSSSHHHEVEMSLPSTPSTPATPGAPLFKYGIRKPTTAAAPSLLSKLSCFSVQDWSVEEGRLPPLSCSFSPPPFSLARKVGAEFIGTLILIFAGTATAIVNQKTGGSESLIGLAASTGLAAMVVILSTGHISGAHLNPAVTIAFAALRHFPWRHVPVYIGAQVLASLCAGFVLKAVFHPVMDGGVTVPSGDYAQAFALEFIISFILMFVVTAVSTDTRAVGELAGIAVGGTVMLNILIAGNTTGASMNPVRTLGPAVAANNYRAIWIYLTAPVLGALCGAGTYVAVKLPQEDSAHIHIHDKPSTSRTFTR